VSAGKDTGSITVSGPGVERSYNGQVTLGAALSAAQGLAVDAEPGGTRYVRDRDARVAYRVEPHADATLTFRVPKDD
jgi:hypothetical protein